MVIELILFLVLGTFWISSSAMLELTLMLVWVVIFVVHALSRFGVRVPWVILFLRYVGGMAVLLSFVVRICSPLEGEIESSLISWWVRIVPIFGVAFLWVRWVAPSYSYGSYEISIKNLWVVEFLSGYLIDRANLALGWVSSPYGPVVILLRVAILLLGLVFTHYTCRLEWSDDFQM